MRGRTHVTTGMAASILLTNPSTVPGVIAALTGGAIGGTIGGMATTLITGKSGRFVYAVIGFFMMLMSQIVFVGYLMMIGVI